MQISGEQHNRLMAEGAMVSVNGRWYIALDALDVGFGPALDFDLALNLKHQPEPQTDAGPPPEADTLKAPERRHGRKTDVEGAAGPS
jgi:hypothetical protein